jgi:hypothetical protein
MQSRNVIAKNERTIKDQNLKIENMAQKMSRLETIIQEFET